MSRHGEAVAIGIALDTRYSVLAGLLDAKARRTGWRRCSSCSDSASGTRCWMPERQTAAIPLLEGLRDFREHLGGELTITLLEEIGRGTEVHEMDEARVGQSIAWLKGRQSRR